MNVVKKKKKNHETGHIQLGDGFCIQFVHFQHSYVDIGKPTKTLCMTVHAPMTLLNVSIINFIY